MVGLMSPKEQVRRICLSLPHVTEQVQWGDHLLFKISGKMFAITSLEPSSPAWLSFKASPEQFGELTERPGFIPAPYLARAKWVSIESGTTVPRLELERLLRTSYDLVTAKLPKKRTGPRRTSPTR
jgi:predicted DNA-binding protein (MmcQ/YjbR family)